MIYIDLNNYQKSSECFFKCLKIYENIKDPEGIEETLGDIGNLYFYQGNYKKALNYFNRALKMAREQKNEKNIARGLNNIAAIYESDKDYIKATKYFEEANAINIKLKNIQGIIINSLNLGITNFKLENFDKSLYYFNKADSLAVLLNNSLMQIRVLIGLAEYYLNINELIKAKDYALEALNKATKLEKNQQKYDAIDILHKAYSKQGDINNAYRYLQLQLQLKDSLNKIEDKVNLSKLELLYSIDKKEQRERIKEQKNRLYIFLTAFYN